MTSTLTYREEKQKEWEKLIKKHRLTFVTHGDDPFHEFLERLHFSHALKVEEDYRVYFQDGNETIQFSIDDDVPNQVWIFKCVKGKTVADEVLASYLKGTLKIWYENGRTKRTDLHDFFNDLQLFMRQLTEE